MVGNQRQDASKRQQGYDFEGTKVQKYLQKNTNLPEKDNPALVKCQNFGQNEDKNDIINDILHGKTEVHLQNNRREEDNTFKGGDEGERPRPVFAFFTFKEHQVYRLIEDGLSDKIGNEDTKENADKLVGGIYQEGVSDVVGDVKIRGNGQ